MSGGSVPYSYTSGRVWAPLPSPDPTSVSLPV